MSPCSSSTGYVGRWKYNVRSAKTGEKKSESGIVEITIPAIVDKGPFDQVTFLFKEIKGLAKCLQTICVPPSLRNFVGLDDPAALSL
jgi:hypothetical protein